jgi:hypothetical protein
MGPLKMLSSRSMHLIALARSFGGLTLDCDDGCQRYGADEDFMGVQTKLCLPAGKWIFTSRHGGLLPNDLAGIYVAALSSLRTDQRHVGGDEVLRIRSLGRAGPGE